MRIYLFIGWLLTTTSLYAVPPVFNIADFGARNDGITLNTQAIQQAIDAAFAEHFGKTENVVLYVVEADAVLTPPVLQYMLDLGERVSQDPWVRRMESIATTPIPRGGPDALVVDSPIQGDTVEQSEVDELAAALQMASFARGPRD